MAKTDIVRSLVEPLAAAEGADVYDVTFAGGKLAVAINRQGGIDLDTLADISRELGERLDADDVIGGSYTLEVTSPGLERPLRTPGHYAGAVGEDVTIRTKPDTEGERRVRGTIVESVSSSPLACKVRIAPSWCCWCWCWCWCCAAAGPARSHSASCPPTMPSSPVRDHMCRPSGSPIAASRNHGSGGAGWPK